MPASHPQEWGLAEQPHVVWWLLQEAPLSAQSIVYFRVLVERQPTVGVEVLRSSGLLSVHNATQLRRAAAVLIPLLSVATTPEFGLAVLNELLNQLEWRLQQCGPALGTSTTTTTTKEKEEEEEEEEGGRGRGGGGKGSSGSTRVSPTLPQEAVSASWTTHAMGMRHTTPLDRRSPSLFSSSASSRTCRRKECYPCFTDDELDGLAALGTALMTLGSLPYRDDASTPMDEKRASGSGDDAVSSSSSSSSSLSPSNLSFESFGSRLQEIEVMDGSPVALVKAMYHWGRHVLTAEVGAFFTGSRKSGGDGGDGAGREGNRSVWKNADAPPSAASSRKTSSSSSSSIASYPLSMTSSSVALSLVVRHMEGSLRWSISDSLRQRFLRFLEGLVQSFVQAERRVRSPALHAFVHRHIPVPNIQDEYRRKLYFLVNVTDGRVDPSSSALLRVKRGRREGACRLSDASIGGKGRGKGKEGEGPRKRKADRHDRPPRWIPPLLWFKLWSSWTTMCSMFLGSSSSSSSSSSREGQEHRDGFSPTTACGGVEEETKGPKKPFTERKEGEKTDNDDDDENEAREERGYDDPIPQELRLLVSTLPHTLSPYASVAILRDVLAKSAGGNPRYTYVCRAALDLQLPISTTRSRVATAMNMWSFLRTQSSKLPYSQWLLMQKRCVINLPLSYILSSYWVVISWSGVVLLVALHFFGMDYESKVLATSCQGEFGLPEELMVVEHHEGRPRDEDAEPESVEEGEREAETPGSRSSSISAVDGSTEDFNGDGGASPPLRTPMAGGTTSPTPGDRPPWRPASGLLPLLSSLLGSDRGDLKATLYVLDPQRSLPGSLVPPSSSSSSSFSSWREEEVGEEEEANEYRRAMYLVKQISAALRFPFFVDIEKLWTLELLEARVAERMRRVSSNHTWFWLRPVVRFFPLGLRKTEENLISSTCLRADRQYKRVTFIVYIHDHVPVTYTWLVKLRQHSCLSRSANVVVVAHPESLRRGGVGKAEMDELKRAAKYDVQYPAWSEGGGGKEGKKRRRRRRRRRREEAAAATETRSGEGKADVARPSLSTPPSSAARSGAEEDRRRSGGRLDVVSHWLRDVYSTTLFPPPPYPSFHPALQSLFSSPSFPSSFYASHSPLCTTTPSSSSSTPPP